MTQENTVRRAGQDRLKRPIDFYVAPDGRDSWSGTLPERNAPGTDGPFSTLTRARDAIRRLKGRGGPNAPVRVLVRGGTYRLTEPFVLRPEDSGSPEAPVIYMACPGEKAIISGGRVITGFTPADGPLFMVNLPEVKAGRWYFRQLFVNRRRCTRARLPKAGEFFLTAGMLNPDDRDDEQNRRGFRFHPGELRCRPNWEESEIVLIHRFDIVRMHPAEIDEAAGVVRFAAASLFPYQENRRYWVENVRAGLIEPGTWYLDRREGNLYYWPMPGEDLAKGEVVAPAMNFLMRLEGDIEDRRYVEHITIKGLTFCHTDWPMLEKGYPSFQAAFETRGVLFAEGARHCRIEGNEITHIGTYGIEFGRACRDNVVARNHIHDVGAGGVKIGEGEFRRDPEDQTCRNEVTDNTIHDGGQVHLGAVGVWVGQASHTRVAHNHIYDLFYTGVSIGWEWYSVPQGAHHNVVELNHIHDVMRRVLSDGGGIYSLGIQSGTVIRNNLIHHVYTHDPGAGRGIYLDAASFGVRVENNVVHHIQSAGIRAQIATAGNLIRNNIVALCEEAQLGFDSDRTNLWMHNIVYYRTGRLFTRESFRNHDQVIDYNLYFNPVAEVRFLNFSFAEWQKLPGTTRGDWEAGLDAHSLIADPRFADPENGDFTLAPDSPAFTVGFTPIDLSTVGPRPPEPDIEPDAT